MSTEELGVERLSYHTTFFSQTPKLNYFLLLESQLWFCLIIIDGLD